MLYAPLMAVLFCIIGIAAMVAGREKAKREAERLINMKWNAIQQDVKTLYYMLHYTVKQLHSMHDNPAVVDLAIDMEKLERPMDHRRLYSVMVQLREDMERVKLASAEYNLGVDGNVVVLISKVVSELEDFIRLVSEYEKFRKVFRWQ